MFNAAIFNNAIFNVGEISGVAAVIKTGTGGIDPPKRRRLTIVKPTGLVDRPLTPVEERTEAVEAIHQEVRARVAREFTEEPEAEFEFKPISTMSLVEIDREIGMLLRKKMRDEEDEMLLILLLAASV